MTYLLGVDGGNSKTLAVVADHTGAVRGVGRAGCGNHQGPGLDAAMRAIHDASHDALRQADVAPDDIQVAAYLLAGADLEEDFALLRPALANLRLGRQTVLDNDTIAVLRSGTDRSDAVGIVLGAGTNAAGRNAAGHQIRLPGLGWVSGDWGGGGDIAQAAVALAAREWDGRGAPTALAALIPRHFGDPDIFASIRRIYHRRLPPHGLLELVPLVFEAAAAGDVVAQDLVRRQGDEVATTALALLRRLELLELPSDVVLGGSVFRGAGTLLVDTIADRLRPQAPWARLVRPDVEPVIGSIFLALDEAGIPVTDDVRHRARDTWTEIASPSALRNGGTGDA